MGKYKYSNTNHASTPSLCIPSPVDRITGIWEFSIPGGHRSSCRSLPSYLIHLITKGSYRLRTNGREYDIRTGDVICYYESEEVEWLGDDGLVTFYSVGFDAPRLPPPPLEARVFPGSQAMKKAFQDVYSASLQAEPLSRSLAVHAALLQVLLEVHRHNEAYAKSSMTDISRKDRGSPAQLWWRIEQEVRQKRRYRPSLEEMADWIGCSRATVCRACQTATGESPMRRLRNLRMAEAKGLLLLSTMNVSHVADYLGYPRVHEFSRDYRGYFGHPPTATRA